MLLSIHVLYRFTRRIEDHVDRPISTPRQAVAGFLWPVPCSNHWLLYSVAIVWTNIYINHVNENTVTERTANSPRKTCSWVCFWEILARISTWAVSDSWLSCVQSMCCGYCYMWCGVWVCHAPLTIPTTTKNPPPQKSQTLHSHWEHIPMGAVAVNFFPHSTLSLSHSFSVVG